MTRPGRSKDPVERATALTLTGSRPGSTILDVAGVPAITSGVMEYDILVDLSARSIGMWVDGVAALAESEAHLPTDFDIHMVDAMENWLRPRPQTADQHGLRVTASRDDNHGSFVRAGSSKTWDIARPGLLEAPWPVPSEPQPIARRAGCESHPISSAVFRSAHRSAPASSAFGRRSPAPSSHPDRCRLVSGRVEQASDEVAAAVETGLIED